MIENINMWPLLLMTFLPALTALAVLAMPQAEGENKSRWVALVGAIATLLVSLRFASDVVGNPASYFAGVNVPWIKSYGISLLMGMDGLSGMLVLLTNVLQILAILGSWTAITKRNKAFYCFLMLLQTGILGTFLALDLILFYVFWEMMLIPLYFLIGIFGSGNRIYATTKFFLYTMAGSVVMLVGMLLVYFKSGLNTFALPELLAFTTSLAPAEQLPLFLMFFLAFAIKVPLFPVHTWLPDAHTEAPTAGSVILAGVLLKTGVYGILRFCIPMFPFAALEMAPIIMALSVVAIIYGALTAFYQTDMKRLVAYSSVSHMGFIVLGVFAFRAEAVTGASLQMLCHGISTGGLFLCVGYLYERRHTRELSQFGGLARNMKVYAVLTMLMVLSSVGLPGLNGFAGEFLILMGTFKAAPVMAILAGTGVILAACYLLRMVEKTFFGQLDNEENKTLKDLNPREIFTLVVLAVFSLWMGVYPSFYTQALEPASKKAIEAVELARGEWGDPGKSCTSCLFTVVPGSGLATPSAHATEHDPAAEVHGEAQGHH